MMAYLLPEELTKLTCVAKWHSSSEHRSALWHSYFVFRWGCEQCASSGTQIRLMPSWVEDAWPAPWPLAAGFCGARSVMDHMLWQVPVMRCVLRLERPRHGLPPPLRQSLAWQVACHVRCKLYGEERLSRCFICDVLEVAPQGPSPQHFRRRWAKPCSQCVGLAHRSCLERLLLEQVPKCPPQHVQDMQRWRADPQLPCCSSCGCRYQVAGRFPETFAELLLATCLQWRWVLRRLIVVFLFFMWLYSLAEHYCALGTSYITMFALLALTATLMGISVNQRTHRGIKLIWNTPNRWRIFQVFGFAAVLSYTAVLRMLQPSVWATFAQPIPWLMALHNLHSLVHSTWLGMLLLSGLTLFYATFASGLIFLFWKTSLRVPTVADASDIRQEQVLYRTSKDRLQCGLCQLGLCLDNTSM